MAHFDPSRGARVVARTALLYQRGPDPSIDRPAHVRAGSALAVLPTGQLAVIQDDACFLAIIDRASGAVTDVPFPGDGPRQFDDLRGNKKEKLDLEAVFITPGGVLIALGSGSSPLRERIVIVEGAGSSEPRVRIVHAHALYAQLRAHRSFSGSELNVEGATIVGGDVVLFQRGNGAPAPSVMPVDATARMALGPLVEYLDGGPLPPLRDICPWDLGHKDGHRLTFTDGAVHARAGAIAFLACAEDSPDATRDGPVSAVMLGCLDEATGACALGPILDERGAPLLDKAEGFAFDPDDASRAFVVTDRDDPTAPSELLVLELGAAWLAP